LDRRKLHACCVPTLQLRKGEAEIKGIPLSSSPRYGGAPCFDALLGFTELRMQEAALPFDVSARCGVQKLSSRRSSCASSPLRSPALAYSSAIRMCHGPGRLCRVAQFELPGCGGVDPLPGIQVAQALVQRGGIPMRSASCRS